ncbi:BQ5605_C001g00918 [Microbotryum silenes-dioicae]|uniref:NEDD8-activating enzyme E1 catalytic subunit n=1 Tax=Microbotryum silenes-dioicae TaxID=796604 RepID=A0A2X0M8Z4_9BASI|nr:BQ5605_C001g00918 [Microbotryum silenes-dioicae]
MVQATPSTSTSSPASIPNRWQHLDRILTRRGPFVDEDSFRPTTLDKSFLHTEAKILVIGAGGLGCEILANLALLGFTDLHVIDMDTIDVSNLNRQFLFRPSDVGQSKAECAARFIMHRVPGVTVTPYHGKIQDKDDAYYMSFNIVVCGLDSVQARRWISATLVNLVDPEVPESLKPLVDGGTEGFKGQARVILPTVTSCYECSLDMLTPPTAFPICTIANTPRLPEHCIEWASLLEWPKVFKDKKLDTDNPEHIEWLYTTALERAQHHSIEGVTWSLTQGVVKRIIPAIASTNAIVAAACCNEVFKIASSSNPYLNNYMLYTGNDEVYTYTFEHHKKDDCPVCGDSSIRLDGVVGRDDTLQQLVDVLIERGELQIKKPSLSLELASSADHGTSRPTRSKKLYFQAPPQLEEMTRPNLDKTLGELFESVEGGLVTVTDQGLPFSLGLEIIFKKH